MSRSALFVLLFLLIGTSYRTAAAQASASQQVTIVVEEVSALSLSTPSVTLTLGTVQPGRSDYDDATDGTATYNLTNLTNESRKITGQLDADYASGIRLKVRLGAPAGSAAAQQVLSTTPQTLVSGIGNVREKGLPISYTASANSDAVPNAASGGETHTVTYTVTL